MEEKLAQFEGEKAAALAELPHTAEKNLKKVLSLVGWDQLPTWQQDNHFIRSGYRPASGSYLGSFQSLGHLHNETVNITTIGAGCAVVSINSEFRKPKWRPFRATMFVGMGLSAVFPVFHGVKLYGIQRLDETMGLSWVVLQGLLYVLGAAIYALRVPERWGPGQFDIWCNSHQIFHMLVLCAAAAHLVGLLKAFDCRHSVALDVDGQSIFRSSPFSFLAHGTEVYTVLLFALSVLVASGIIADDPNRFVDNDGAKIHYLIYGSGEPPFLIFTHGFPDNSATWFNQLPYFLARNYTIITPTLRGFPPSSVPPLKSDYDAAHFTSDMLAIFQDAQVCKPAYLVGHDIGGGVVQQFAYAHHDLISTIVMVNTPILPTFLPLIEFDAEQQSLSSYTWKYYRYEPGQPKNATSIARDIRNATYRNSIVDYLNASPIQGMLNFYSEQFPGPPYFDLSTFNYSLARYAYKQPSQIIYGIEDPFFSIRGLDGLSKWFPHGLRLVTLPGAGHWSFQDAPNKFNHELESFLVSN
ncbi:MAG: hypothetical protein M1822_002651 [Bathelium mastoideum]|nr:MAG: hypothetical protein M1822_002651 [Bathelium mastoideum]